MTDNRPHATRMLPADFRPLFSASDEKLLAGCEPPWDIADLAAGMLRSADFRDIELIGGMHGVTDYIRGRFGGTEGLCRLLELRMQGEWNRQRPQ